MAGSSKDFRQEIARICTPLPGAKVSDPWGGGHDAWKVCDKMFASIGATIAGVAVKTESIETAEMLIAAGLGITKAPYFHKSWVLLPEISETSELEHRIYASYDIVRGGLSKKMQASLSPRKST